MPGLPVAGCILVAAFLLGAQALDSLRVWRGARSLPTAEKALFALGLGMVLLAYIVLAVGLVGLLRPWMLYGVVLGSVAVGFRQWRLLASAVTTLWSAFRRGVLGPSPRRALHIFLVAWCVLTLVAALAPPTDNDDDGLSQHLATPKIYLRHARIEPLWFDHHSQFPSTLQMLYTVGLSAGSAEAAKVIHWACGVAGALALVVLGRRFLPRGAGAWSAFALLTIPLMGWLATLAYVDLAGVFYAALLLLGLRTWAHTGRGAHLFLAAVAAGGGMAVKMQGIQLLAVAALAALVCGIRLRMGAWASLRRAFSFSLIACALAAPWYVKSFLWTGNPVYPFAYGVFGGVHWSQDQAEPYRHHQLQFGVGDPPGPSESENLGFLQRTFYGPRSPLNLLMAPWNLAMRPREFDVLGMNPWHAAMWCGIGPLALAMLPLLLLRRPPGTVWLSLGMFALLWVGWLMLMQYSRYLLPNMVFVCVPVGYVLAAGLPKSGVGRTAPRLVAWSWGAYAMLGICLAGLMLGSWKAGLGITGRAEYLQASSSCYRWATWVNRLTPETAKVALYSEPRGFYLDREYLWADPGHSRLIEYKSIRSADDLLDAYAALGVTHILHRQLPGAPRLFLNAEFDAMLRELVDDRRVRFIGRPEDQQYTLFRIDTPWAEEILE